MVNNDLVRKTYDGISKNYYQSQSHSVGKDAIKSCYEDFLKHTKPLSVLDLGCGAGDFATIAKRLGAKRVVGIDISPEQIRLAERLAQEADLGISYSTDDIAKIELNEQFEGIVSAFGFCYADTKDVLQKELSLAHKHLKDNGHLFAVVCDPQRPLREWGYNYRVSLESTELQDGAKLKCEFVHEGVVTAIDYKFYWSKQTWVDVLGRAGFRNITWIELNPGATNTILLASK